MNSALSGVILISGLWGAGKTTLGLSLTDPKDVVMWDLDQKSEVRAKELAAEYHALTDLSVDPTEPNVEAVIKWLREQTAALTRGKKVLLIDNGSPLEEAFHSVVEKNPKKWRLNPENVAAGRFGGSNPGVSKIWRNLIGYTQNLGFQCIVITMHMSELWAGGAPVGKYKVKGNKVLTELANLSLVLMKSDKPNTAPRALVGKEALGMVTYQEGAFKSSMALPPVIPICTWPNIEHYIDIMPTRTKFTPEELPTRADLERYGQWLSDDQRALVMAVAKNPHFSMTEEETTALVKEREFTSWDEVRDAAVTELGLTIEQARTAIRPFYEKKVSFEEAWKGLQ